MQPITCAMLLILAAPVALASTMSPQCEEKLLSSGGLPFDGFGAVVDIDGDRCVIGAFRDDSAATDGGAAHVFRKEPGGAWVHEAELLVSNTQVEDRFGTSVAISGARIAVGSFFAADHGLLSGSVHLFVFDGFLWQEEAVLAPDDATADQAFGFSASLDGERILVGAPGDDQRGPSAGAAYVFRLIEGQWRQEAKIAPAGLRAGDELGVSVALQGHRALVGARSDNAGVRDSGAAYVFRRSRQGWIQEAKLKAADPEIGASFGSDLDLDEDRAVVGAYLSGFNDEGAAYVFLNKPGGTIANGQTWTLESKLMANGALPNDHFGQSVVIEGLTIAVGVPEDNPGDAGSVRVFRPVEARWKEKLRIQSALVQPSDRFGVEVGLSQDQLLVGAFEDDDLGRDSGSAYVFDFGCGSQGVLAWQPPPGSWTSSRLLFQCMGRRVGTPIPPRRWPSTSSR